MVFDNPTSLATGGAKKQARYPIILLQDFSNATRTIALPLVMFDGNLHALLCCKLDTTGKSDR